MLSNRLRVLIYAVAIPIAMASCAGGGSQMPAPSTESGLPQAAGAVQTYDIKTPDGMTAAVTLHSNAALSNLTVAFKSQGAAQSTSRRSPMTVLSCPISPIILTNNSANAKTTVISSITVKLKCSLQGLFGASFYQIIPSPTTVVPLKLGDATANGMTLTFTPSANVDSVVLASRTSYQITILPETSTADVAFPVVPNAPATLTANASSFTSGLIFKYTTTSGGGTTYTVACQLASTNGILNPEIAGLPKVGKPKFFCDVSPADSPSLTFGQAGSSSNTFTINNPDPDRAVIVGDGTVQGFQCNANASPSCNAPTFVIGSSSQGGPPAFQRFISGNVQDLRACVPQSVFVDCNGVTGDTQGGSVTSVSGGREFEVLVADDPTYMPGTPAAPVPWTGKLYASVSGACQLNTGPDLDTGDHPPLYTDGPVPAIGPNAEFDVNANFVTTTSTCTFSVTEDPTGAYITDLVDNPASPQPRSASITITVNPGSGD